MPYGDWQYGAVQFGDELGGVGGTDETGFPDLMAYLPGYYRNSRIMRSVQEATAQEIGLADFALTDVLRQFFVTTATWGLDIWEEELGIVMDRSKPYNWRREVIMAKLRGTGTATRQMIIDAAATFSGGEVEVIEYPEEYRFVVQFIGILGIPPNMAGFIAMLEQIKPAHLAHSFLYTFTAWSMLAEETWADVGTKTWNELRVYEGA